MHTVIFIKTDALTARVDVEMRHGGTVIEFMQSSLTDRPLPKRMVLTGNEHLKLDFHDLLAHVAKVAEEALLTAEPHPYDQITMAGSFLAEAARGLEANDLAGVGLARFQIGQATAIINRLKEDTRMIGVPGDSFRRRLKEIAERLSDFANDYQHDELDEAVTDLDQLLAELPEEPKKDADNEEE